MEAVLVNWDKIQTKTTYEDISIDFLSGSEAIVRTTEITAKIGGDGFYPDNRAKFRYTLHKEDGQWKIHNLEMLDLEILEPHKLFDHAIAVPDDVYAALRAVVEKQLKAANEEDLDAYMATMIYESEEQKEEVLEIIGSMFELFDAVSTLEKFAVVEYNGSDEAVLLLSIVQEVTIEDESVKGRTIMSGGARKVDGNWLLKAEMVSLSMEILE